MNSKLCGIIVSLFVLSHLNLNAQIILADKTDRSVVAFAQVTDEKGNTIAMSDMDGRVCMDGKDGQAFIVKHLSYEPEKVKISHLTNGDTLWLSPVNYNLNEVSVSARQLDYIHLRAYFRSYQQNDSCLKYFKDGIVHYYIPLRGKRVRRHMEASRLLENKSLIAKDRKRANSVIDKYITTPYLEGKTLFERIKSQADAFEEGLPFAKLFIGGVPTGICKQDSLTRRVEYDALALEGGKREGKLFGYTTRIEEFVQTEIYRRRTGYQSYLDLLSHRDYRKIFYKYKKDNREQLVEVTDELYVLSQAYVTAEEMKQALKEEKEALGVEENYWLNPAIPPIHEYLQSVLERELLPAE